MIREELYVQLNEVFHDVFDDDTIALADSTTADDVEDWDSLAHMNLIVAVEKAFKIKFTIADLKSFDKVGSMVDNILGKLA